jgi:hypothetical protein
MSKLDMDRMDDIVFPSPSAASNFVLGRSSNGLTEWKKENGETLKERIDE